VNKHIQKRLTEINKRWHNGDDAVDEDRHMNLDLKYYVPIPYVKSFSENLRRIFGTYGLSTLYTVPKKMDALIKKGKDRLNINKCTGVVYKLECADCNACYIGQTKRHLETRVKEHRSDISKHHNQHSVVSKHRLDFNHDFKWHEAKILHREQNLKKREISEMLFIKKHEDAINSQKDTENLPTVYDRILFSL
jgi:hypothetical protein